MKRYWVWLKLEWKRAAGRLPAMLTEAVILAVAAGMIAFCGHKLAQLQKETKESVVVVASGEEEGLTELAVSFVQGMEALKGWCRLVIETEETGERMLREGEAIAMIVLPERMVESILDGTNIPATLYLVEDMPGAAQLLQELASAGVALLSTAQGEIYAAHALYELYGSGGSLEEMYQDINRYNLSLALNREELFKTKNVSATEGRSLAVYYGGAAAAVYILLLGMALGEYPLKPSVRIKVWSRLGIPISGQAAGQWIVIGTWLLIGSIPPLTAGVWAKSAGIRMPSIAAAAAVMCSIFCTAALIQLLYILIENRRHVLMCLAAGTAVLGFACGCFIPEALLPAGVKYLAASLPLTYMREAWSGFFQGRSADMGSCARMLLLFTGACLLCSCLLLSIKGEDRSRGVKQLNCDTGKNGTGTVRKSRLQTAAFKGHDGEGRKFAEGLKERMVLLYILTKRLLSQRSFWLCICLIPLLSLLMTGLEKTTETSVYGAVYAESEEMWQEVFGREEGLFRFYFCSSLEELKRDVVSGKAECGYVLTEDLQNKFQEDDWYGAVTVYRSPDTMLSDLINETVFSKIFNVISSKWYEGYIANVMASTEAAKQELMQQTQTLLEKERSSQNTFDIRIQSLTSESQADQEALYPGGKTGKGQEASETVRVFPVKGMTATGIFLCGLLGAGELLRDRQKKYFFRSPRFFAAVMTTGLPVLFGTAVGYATLVFTGKADKILPEAGHMLLYGLAVTVYGVLLSCLVRKEKVMAGLLPVLVLGSLLCTPVFLDLTGIFPALKLVEILFPAAGYLRGAL